MDQSHRASVLAASCLSTPVNPHTRVPVTLYERQQEMQNFSARDTEDISENEGCSSSRLGGRDWEVKHEINAERNESENVSARKGIQQLLWGKAPLSKWRNSSDPEMAAPTAVPQSLLYPTSKDNSSSESDAESEQNLSQSNNQAFESRLHLAEMNSSNKEYYAQLEQLKNAHLETMAQLECMYQRKLHVNGVVPHCKQDPCAGGCRSAWEPSSSHKDHFQKSLVDMDLHSMASSNSSDTSDDELTDEHILSELRAFTPAEKQILTMWNGFSVEDYVARKQKSPRPKKKKEWSPKITVPEPFQMTMREAKKKEQHIKTKSEIEMENNLLKKYLEEEAECQRKFKANPVPASVFLPLYREIVERNEERRNFVKERRRELLLASQQPFQFIEREERKKEMLKEQLESLPAPKKTRPFKAKPVPKSIYSTTHEDRLQEEELYRGIKIQMRAQELLRNSAEPRSLLASRSMPSIHKDKCFQKEKRLHKPKINPEVPDFEALHRKFQKQLLKKKDAKPITVCEPFYLHTLQIASNKSKILEDIQADEERLYETRWPYQTPRRKPQTGYCSTNSSPCTALEYDRRTTESEKRRQQAIRDDEKQRMREYFQELGQMESRIDKRPLLLERVSQNNARLSAEKHFSKVLNEVGLGEDPLLGKGRPVKSVHNFSDEESKAASRNAKSYYMMMPEECRTHLPVMYEQSRFYPRTPDKSTTDPHELYEQSTFLAEPSRLRVSFEDEKIRDSCRRNHFDYKEDKYSSDGTCSEEEAD
ncbi:protein FAM161A isoform X2 [Ambystoma mexicanum]|uniref:protein FAM161A isoform X2 n=1 Tax=Ambystoma mexicanum TaxID=8296 RepID=UPI0037E7ED64